MNFSAQFKEFLFSKTNPSSKATVKNYLSDVNRFIGWFEKKYQESFSPSEVNSQVLSAYEKEGLSSYSPSSTARNLSSLRKFFSFLKLEGHISHSPFEAEANIHKAETDPWRIKDFKNHLFVFNASHLTIKNYIIDVKQFLSWAEAVLDHEHEFEVSSKNPFEKINTRLIEEYKTRLINEARLSPVSVNRKLSSIRRYISWAKEEGFINSEVSVPNQTKLNQEINTGLQPTEAITSTPKTSGYSWFPPLRLAQKTRNGLVGLADGLIIFPLLGAIEKAEHIIWRKQGKPVTSGTGVLQALINSRQKSYVEGLKVKNVPKSFYAPALISTKYFPLHKKVWHHVRNTRPNWYRKYQNTSAYTYFRFAIIVLFVAALSYALYSYVNPNKKQAPTLAAGLPNAPNRVLSFQGRLTDASDNPITSSTTLRMAIYSNSTASGAALLWQEIVTVGPDNDGIFATLLGNNTAIPQEVFANFKDLWLGVTVGQTPELTPRQQIATVGFATNAEFLQGLPPITNATNSANVVLALNSSGNLVIGNSSSPTFQATGGTFTVSGQTLSLQTNTGSAGNIALAPDGLGKIDLQKPLQNTTLNNNLTQLGGGVEIDDNLGVLASGSGAPAFLINQTSTGDLISASTSAVNKFRVDKDGNLNIAGSYSIGGTQVLSSNTLGSGVTASSLTSVGTLTGLTMGGTLSMGANSLTSSGTIGTAATTNFTGLNITMTGALSANGSTGTGSQCLLGGATAAWGACASGGSSPFTTGSGAIFPLNSTLDFLIGGQATTSADFAVTGVNGSGIATASVSGNFIAMPKNGAGGAVGIGTTSPIGKFNIESPTFLNNLSVVNNGTTGAPPTIPNSYLSTLTVANSESVGSRPLFFGYVTGGNWEGYFTTGACGAFTSMCVDLGNGATDYTALKSVSTTLFLGGANGAANSGDGNFTDVIFGNTGNIGIGTASPISQLHVTRDLALGATGKALAIFDQIENQDILTASKSGVAKFTIANDGSLTMSGTTITASSLATLTSSATVNWGTITALNFTSAATTLSIGTTGNGTIEGSTANNGDLTIQGTSSSTRTSSDLLLQPNGGFTVIGRTSNRNSANLTIEEPSSNKLNVITGNFSTNNGDYVAHGFRVSNDVSPDGAVKGGIFFQRKASSGRGDFYFTLNNTDSAVNTTTADEVLHLTRTGQVFMVAVSTGTTTGSACMSSAGEIFFNTASNTCIASSRATKHDINYISNMGLDQILNLNPVTYIYNDDNTNRTRLGFIAEDVAGINPLFASYGSDGLPNGLSDYGIQAATVQAIKDLNIIVNNQNAESTNRLSSLESDLSLNDDGSLAIVPDVNEQFVVQRNDNAIITRMGAFASLVVAKIRAGSINAQEIATNSLSIATDNITVAGQRLSDYIGTIVDQRLANYNGGNSNNNHIAVNIISPLDQTETGKVKVKLNDNNGKSKFEIQNASGSAVATIDSEGNASISGELSANTASIAGQLSAADASVSGTLRAGRIIADNIEGLDAKIGSLSATTIVNNNYYATPSATSNPYSPISSGSASFDNLFAKTAEFEQGLMSFGSSTFFEASVANRLFVGTQLSIADTSINVIGGNLRLQALGSGGVSFVADQVAIDTDGNLTVNGNATFAKNVAVGGKLYTKVIAPFPAQDLSLELESDSSTLRVTGASNSGVLAINNKGDLTASGAGTFNKLNLNFVPQALAVSDTEVIATGSAGTIILKANKPEVTVNNPLVTPESLIYITPVGSTHGESVYLSRQVPQASFTAGVSTPIPYDIKFNYLIIN